MANSLKPVKKLGPSLLLAFPWAILVTSAVVLLLSDMTLTSAYFVNASGTAIVSVVALACATVYGIALSFRFGVKSLFRDPSWRAQFLILAGLSVLIFAIHLSLKPSWTGAQMLIAFLGFSLTLFVFSFKHSEPFNHTLSAVLTGALAVFAALYLIRYSVDLQVSVERARGQTWVLAAAIVPLIARRAWVGLLLLFFLSLATIVSDSRFAVASLTVVAAFVMMGLLKKEMGKLRHLIAVATGAVLIPLFAVLQNILGMRPSFELPALPALSALDSTPTPVPSIMQPESSVDNPTPATDTDTTVRVLNEWSFGRTNLWLAILRTLASPSNWILGRGPGSASITGEERGINHPHNEYLRFLVDTGAIGLILLVLMGITVLVSLLKSKNRIGDRQFWTGMSLLFLLGSHSLIADTLIQPHFWVPTAVFLGLSLRPIRQAI